MRLFVACMLCLLAALPADAGSRRERQKDCVPYNGPFGFYGNIWCQPPNVSSYNRNLGASWPQKTPPSLRNPKPTSNYDW
jgi:hypothetical protein